MGALGEGELRVAAQSFVKKPVVVEAMPWAVPITVGDLMQWGAVVRVLEPREGVVYRMVEAQEIIPGSAWEQYQAGMPGVLQVYVAPEQSWVTCPAGHWVVRGVKGEFYPVHPEVFEATYEPAGLVEAAVYAGDREAVARMRKAVEVVGTALQWLELYHRRLDWVRGTELYGSEGAEAQRYESPLTARVREAREAVDAILLSGITAVR